MLRGATERAETAQPSTVVAQNGNAGPSTSRLVAPQRRQEGSSLEPRSVAERIAAAEEEALADQSLPVSRRAEIRAYFLALRKQAAP